jgi:hypothetical protein
LIEHIKNKIQTLAIIIRASFQDEGIKFFTPDDYSLQLAYMNRPIGYEIKPHVHCRVDRQTQLTQEVLVMKSGKLRVDFYNDEKFYLTSRVLMQGDVILLASGGHGFEALEAVEIIEVKQGPYAKDLDKVRFESVTNDELNFGVSEQ